MKTLSINVTGHRPGKLFGFDIHSKRYDALRKNIKRSIFNLANEHVPEEIIVYSGMALGVDQIFVECCIDARAYYRSKGIGFKIIAAIPCHGQDNKWNESSRKLYNNLLQKCDKKIFVHNGTYTSTCMEERNRYMVNHSDCTIAVWDGSRSGTGNCVNDAKRKGNEIVIINPFAAL